MERPLFTHRYMSSTRVFYPIRVVAYSALPKFPNPLSAEAHEVRYGRIISSLCATFHLSAQRVQLY